MRVESFESENVPGHGVYVCECAHVEGGKEGREKQGDKPLTMRCSQERSFLPGLRP